MSRPEELLLDKLLLSGLDLEDAIQLDISPVLNAQTLHQSFKPVMAMQIPYHNAVGDPRPDLFYRLRYLEQEVSFIPSSQRYTQLPGSSVTAYFPRLFEWSELIHDPKQPVCITEGELKAAAACKAGFTTIGLGGVYSWRSAKMGIALLPELAEITWRGRSVYLVFDSDAKTNPMVTQALAALAGQLTKQGAVPYIVNLVELEPGVKTGVDDLLVAQGPDALDACISSAKPWHLAGDLWRLNEEIVYVQDPGLVIVQADGRKIAPRAFKDHAYANRRLTQQHTRPNGRIALKEVSLPKAWLEWSQRHEAARLTYAPGKAARMVEGEYNTWRGWGCEPAEGDVQPWHWLLDRLFGEDLAGRQWFEQWCAYPIQYPGTKMFTASMLWGLGQGTGKTLVGVTLGRIYGDLNYSLITQQDLSESWSDWAYDKQFVLADDLSGSGYERRHSADVLKAMVTRLKARIKIKYVPTFETPDVLNYLATSNHSDALFLEEDDRRWFVHEVLADRMDEDEQAEYALWLDSSRGPSALFYHLLHDVDTTDFNPAAPAYKTHSRGRMIDSTASDITAWLRDLRDHPDSALQVDSVEMQCDLFSGRELKALYGEERLPLSILNRELKRAGFATVYNGQPFRVGKVVQRYYAVRNADQWMAASLPDLQEHLLATRLKAGFTPGKF